MSTFANTNKMSSSRCTSNNYYDNQRDDLMDTDDLFSSEQSDVVSMVSEIATDTDVTSSKDDNYHDSSSTDYSLSMDDAPHSMSLSSNCSDSSDSSNSLEDFHEEMQTNETVKTMKTFDGTHLSVGREKHFVLNANLIAS